MKLLTEAVSKTIFKRAMVRFSLLFVLCIGLGDVETADAEDKQRPNVLFIAVDDPYEWTNIASKPASATVIKELSNHLPTRNAKPSQQK